jgi:hypothetical protein
MAREYLTRAQPRRVVKTDKEIIQCAPCYETGSPSKRTAVMPTQSREGSVGTQKSSVPNWARILSGFRWGVLGPFVD